jgi:hypothetical protein
MNPEPAEVRILAFLGTANLLGFLAPDVPGNGNPKRVSSDGDVLPSNCGTTAAFFH